MEAVDPRIIFAAERTMLAWIRTALALTGFGFVVAKFNFFFRETTSGFSPWLGLVLVIMGVAINFTLAFHTQRICKDSIAISL